MSEQPYQPFYKPYGMSDEEYKYAKRIAADKLEQWEAEQQEQEIIEKEIEKQRKRDSNSAPDGSYNFGGERCWYPKCENNIREEDKNLKPETAKLCEKHNDELKKITDGNDIGKVVKFMLLVAEANANHQ